MTDRKDIFDGDDDFDLDALKATVARATPRPDAVRRAADLRLAAENFDRLQGTRHEARPKSERPGQGAWIGVTDMISRLTGKGALTLTTALVACGVLFLTPGGREIWQRPDPAQPVTTTQTTDPVGPGTGANTEANTGENTGTAAATGDTDPTGATAAATVEEPVAPGQVETATAPETVDPLTDPLPDGTAAAVNDSEPETVQEPATEIARTEEARAAGAPPSASEGEHSLDMVMSEDSLVMPAPSPAPQGAMLRTDQAFLQNNQSMALGGVAPGIVADGYAPPLPNTEAFANADENPIRVVALEPVSTFSIDVDTASWSVVRQSLNWGQLPNPDAVRVEEMINYFPYDYAAPDPDLGQPFRPSVTVMDTPWNPDTQLVSIGIQGEMPAVEDRPPLNLVFLIDTSGSMEDPNKLPLLKASFRLMLSQLRPEDQVAIVTYAGSAGLVLPPTAAGDAATILKALDNLAAGGSTAGQAGLIQAYETAEEMMAEGEVTRVILATDGDFNVGASSTEEMESFISDRRDSGVFLSLLGFGRGNLNDALMQSLAQNGNGTAAYIDTLSEAQKVLVDQLTGALFPIASDVKIQVEWNPAVVAEYRLIGYETRALNREDFNNDRVDAGDLGAGHTVTAIYEITPLGSPAVLVDPLRYGTAQAAAPETTTTTDETQISTTSTEIGFLRLRWKEPGTDTSELMETPITEGGPVSDDARFGAAIAGFGQLLRGSEWLGDWGWDEAIALASENRGDDPFGYRNEALGLMRIAASLSSN